MKCKIDADAVAAIVVVVNDAIARKRSARLHAQIRNFIYHRLLWYSRRRHRRLPRVSWRNRCRKYAPMTKSIGWALSSFNHFVQCSMFEPRHNNNNNELL